MSRNLVVRFATNGGAGVVTAAEGLAESAARVGYHVQTYSTFPSQIKGGPIWAQAFVSADEILSSGGQLDILVAMDRYQYDHQIPDLRQPDRDLRKDLLEAAEEAAQILRGDAVAVEPLDHETAGRQAFLG